MYTFLHTHPFRINPSSALLNDLTVWLMTGAVGLHPLCWHHPSAVFMRNRLSPCMFTQSLRSGAGFNGSWNSAHCWPHTVTFISLPPPHPIYSLCPSLPLLFAEGESFFSFDKNFPSRALAVSFWLFPSLSSLYLLSWLPRKACVVCLS